MLKEYRFEKFTNKVESKDGSIADTKIYYRLNEHWVNTVVWHLLYNRAISKGYRMIEKYSKHRTNKNSRYYLAEEIECKIVLIK